LAFMQQYYPVLQTQYAVIEYYMNRLVLKNQSFEH